jgi:cell division septum initiation protein DivIVA
LDISGNMNVAGGNITTHQTTGLSAAEIRYLLDQLYAKIETRPGTPTADKEDLKAEVNEIQSTVTQAANKKKRWMKGFSCFAFAISPAWLLM